MKKLILSILFTLSLTCLANNDGDKTKLSSNLIRILSSQEDSQTRSDRSILALVAFVDNNDDMSLFEKYDCVVKAQIGRIYIVSIPINQIMPLSEESAIERIEAEEMPKPAMDVTPQRVNVTPIYEGQDLPQAFTGDGVISGIFDCYYDFTHPAFFDADGSTRIKYYYDFLWENADGTMGYAIESPDEILEQQHSNNVINHTHGTHVASIMAGSAVDGKYQGIAYESDIYLVDFNSYPEDFDNPDIHTSATAVLGFKYIFDKADELGKPCVINFSSCTSEMFTSQRILESEALESLVGPGRIIVAAAGNFGTNATYLIKEDDEQFAGAYITNGISGAGIISMDIVTPVNQNIRFDFLGMKLTGDQQIEGTIKFETDSIASMQGDTCILRTTVSMGDVELRVYKTDHEDERGDVFHVDGSLPNMAYLILCGATFLLDSDGPAWVYSDVSYCPIANMEGMPEYSCAQPGYTVSWPATLPFIIAVGATGYEATFTNIDGNTNDEMLMFEPDAPGLQAKFSSMGPTYDGLIKPDVVAPGMNINAAYNSFYSDFEGNRKYLTYKTKYNDKDYYYMAQSGTSMAAPVVAGVIALWLEANPKLTPQDILNTIAECSNHPDNTLTYPNNIYGHGSIDAYKGLLHVLDIVDIPSLSKKHAQDVRFYVDGDMLKIDFDDADAMNNKISVSVYTLHGILVATGNDTSIDVSHLPDGIYAVQLNTGSAKTSGSTLIKL